MEHWNCHVFELDLKPGNRILVNFGDKVLQLGRVRQASLTREQVRRRVGGLILLLFLDTATTAIIGKSFILHCCLKLIAT